MAKFDLSDMLKDLPMSDLDTGREQITYLPLDKLLPDPDNFYSLEGLEDLAANIETVGLLEPPRVRPNEDDSYTIVSGHRRRAAIQLIRDGGSQQFADGVPCIIEMTQGVSRSMQELRLIYANSATRVMTAADLSKQAERVTDLLYKLQAEGFQFSGRMRAQVAAACQVSESKIARLHAIRANLDPGLLRYFDSGDMTEDAAYHLSRLPAEIQRRAAEKIETDKKPRMPTGSVVSKIVKQLDSYDQARPCPAHAGGPQCHHLHELMVRDLFQPYDWNVCSHSSCCMDCYSKTSCSKACKEAKDKIKLENAVQKEKDEKREAKLEEERSTRARKICRRAEALLPLIESAGLKDNVRLFDNYAAASVADIKAWARGETKGKVFYDDNCIEPYFTRDLVAMAKRLKCSTDFLVGRTESPDIAAKPSSAEAKPDWMSGTPQRAGLYYCLFTFSNSPNVMKWDPDKGVWRFKGTGGELSPDDVCGWWPLPEV